MKKHMACRIRRIGLGLALVAGVAASGAAQALFLTQTQTLNSNDNPTFTDFNGFNEPGGTLTAVTLSWDMDLALSIACQGPCEGDLEWYFSSSGGA